MKKEMDERIDKNILRLSGRVERMEDDKIAKMTYKWGLYGNEFNV